MVILEIKLHLNQSDKIIKYYNKTKFLLEKNLNKKTLDFYFIKKFSRSNTNM